LPRQAKAKVTPIWRKEARADHIYRVAAEIMCRKGYEATSMNDIADAVGLTKAGMYHYIQGKEHLLFEIMGFAMDMVNENVIAPTRDIADPEERLRALVERHAGQILEVGGEVTILLEEMWALTPAHRRTIRGRKREYFQMVRQTLQQLASEGKLRPVDPTVATFSLFGMINWISRWYRREGKLNKDLVLKDFTEIAVSSVLKTPSNSNGGRVRALAPAK
jgi:TetR/AcrR family transcriptional regulator, cholesterol catabolism regulator